VHASSSALPLSARHLDACRRRCTPANALGPGPGRASSNRRLPAESVVTASTVVHDHMKDNPNFSGVPAPPVDMPTLKAATDLLVAKIAAAAEGGKTVIAEKNQQKEVVVKLLMQLAHYVEANCKDDMTIFLSSGFTPAASTKNLTPPVSESIRRIEPGSNSGEMLVTLVKFPGAASYQVQWAPLAAGGVPGSWTTKPAAAVRPPVLISGLIPGTTYVFQARAVTKAGYSDWSESVTRVSLCNLTPMSSPESGRGHRVQRLVSPVRWSAELRRELSSHRTRWPQKSSRRCRRALRRGTRISVPR